MGVCHRLNFCVSALVKGVQENCGGPCPCRGYAKFSRTLRQGLSISCISKNPYDETFKLVYPHVTDILNEMCEDERVG